MDSLSHLGDTYLVKTLKFLFEILQILILRLLFTSSQTICGLIKGRNKISPFYQSIAKQPSSKCFLGINKIDISKKKINIFIVKKTSILEYIQPSISKLFRVRRGSHRYYIQRKVNFKFKPNNNIHTSGRNIYCVKQLKMRKE